MVPCYWPKLASILFQPKGITDFTDIFSSGGALGNLPPVWTYQPKACSTVPPGEPTEPTLISKLPPRTEALIYPPSSMFLGPASVHSPPIERPPSSCKSSNRPISVVPPSSTNPSSVISGSCAISRRSSHSQRPVLCIPPSESQCCKASRRSCKSTTTRQSQNRHQSTNRKCTHYRSEPRISRSTKTCLTRSSLMCTVSQTSSKSRKHWTSHPMSNKPNPPKHCNITSRNPNSTHPWL